MFPLRSQPTPNRKWVQARDGDYSCRVSPLRDPMPSEPSPTDATDDDGTDEDGTDSEEDAMDEDGEVSASAGAAEDSSTAGRSTLVCSSVRFSRNVADGTKNRFPVTARLKSRI